MTLGYYDWRHGRIVICSDRHRDALAVEDTLVHELVHAYDRAREASMGGRPVRGELRAACSEVRASTLGQCARYRDGWLHLRRSCAFHSAAASLANEMPNARAYALVALVFEQCYGDAAPMRADGRQRQQRSPTA